MDSDKASTHPCLPRTRSELDMTNAMSLSNFFPNATIFTIGIDEFVPVPMSLSTPKGDIFERIPTLLSAPLPNASVFPIEIYERILECVIECNVEDVFMWKHTLKACSLVCRAWSLKSILLRGRVLRFSKGDVRSLYGVRLLLKSTPQLALAVEEVRIRPESWDDPKIYSATMELFPSVLGIHLPRLHTLMFRMSRRHHLLYHRFFHSTNIRVPSITSLELNNVWLWDTSDLDYLLRPYPNVARLALHQVLWLEPRFRVPEWLPQPPRVKRGSKWLPEPPKVIPPVTELYVLYSGCDDEYYVHPNNRVGLRMLLQAFSTKLQKLVLNMGVVRMLGTEGIGELISLGTLETLHLELWESLTLSKALDYDKIIAAIPRLLLRLDSPSLRTIYLQFDIAKVHESPETFLDHIKSISYALEDMVFASHFPCLETITLDVGTAEESIELWITDFREAFPRLASKDVLHVVQPAHRIEYYHRYGNYY
ncbi:hypothetical protein L226DRAFT_47125 [Lentinus tigrinus ALCF2SS1-7]|uniref:uncharacterized protein n=1 Tax=Lentinus tigrinus ALCF2SS1-7 TaxID=1328758 RepID=UPI0011662C37|nr:hypothetical protein L226DRAFT_47125 [Lentinus tigrinus ALCF2SS1-7]